MSRLEFLLQTAWTDLRVQVVSVTDQWAGMAVAGPRARAALQLAFPGTTSPMRRCRTWGCREMRRRRRCRCGMLRLSFSGELAYELYVPADRGVALWEHLLGSAAPLGIKPYGLEALASLRIEKGHVAGLELDHRNTLDDLGLARWRAAPSPSWAASCASEPSCAPPQRWSLVGLECLEPAARLRGGAILFAAGEAIAGHGRGYITSVTWSTVLDKYIALGALSGRTCARGRGDRLRLSAQGRDRARAHRAAGVCRSGRGASACLRPARHSPAAGSGRPRRRRWPARPAARRDARLGARPAGGVPGPARPSWQPRSRRCSAASAGGARRHRATRHSGRRVPYRADPTGWWRRGRRANTRLLGRGACDCGTVTCLSGSPRAPARSRARRRAPCSPSGIAIDLHPPASRSGLRADRAPSHWRAARALRAGPLRAVRAAHLRAVDLGVAARCGAAAWLRDLARRE